MSPADWLWTGLGVVALVVGLVAALFSLRRRPPLAEELYRRFATKEDLATVEIRCKAPDDFVTGQALAALDARHERTSAELFKQIREMRGDMSKGFQDTERYIGRLEGKIDTHLREDRQ